MKVHGQTRQAAVTQTDSITMFGYDLWVAAHVNHPAAMQQLGHEDTHALIGE